MDTEQFLEYLAKLQDENLETSERVRIIEEMRNQRLADDTSLAEINSEKETLVSKNKDLQEAIGYMTIQQNKEVLKVDKTEEEAKKEEENDYLSNVTLQDIDLKNITGVEME